LLDERSAVCEENRLRAAELHSAVGRELSGELEFNAKTPSRQGAKLNIASTGKAEWKTERRFATGFRLYGT